MKKMSKIIALLLCLFFVTAAKSQSPEQMIADWERAKAYTKEYLDAMPEAGYTTKPSPEMRSFAEQMLHFTDANFELASLAGGIQNPVGNGAAGKLANKSKRATTEMVMAGYDFVISVIKKTKVSVLSEPIKLFDKYKMTKVVLINKIFEHQTHHRGQCTVYLRMQGVIPPEEKLF